MDTDSTQEEAVQRDINEAIEHGLWPGEGDALLRVHCECGRADCNEFVRMRADEYERLRSHPRRFVVCGQHQIPAIERIVERGDGYLIVEKTGSAGDAAKRSDPRHGPHGDNPST